MQLLVATRNKHKLKELAAMLGDLPLELVSTADMPHLPGVVEDGATIRDNAVKKAVQTAKMTRKLTVADDTGLEVDALDGAPGVVSARFAGPGATDADNNRLLLEKLKAWVGSTFPFPARFVCRIALVEGDRVEGVYSGSVEGAILESPRGTSGFGYDPLFYYAPFGCTFGEADAARKFSVSHRGQALRAMIQGLSESGK